MAIVYFVLFGYCTLFPKSACRLCSAELLTAVTRYSTLWKFRSHPDKVQQSGMQMLGGRGVYSSLFQYNHTDKKTAIFSRFYKKLGPFYKKKLNPDKIGNKSQVSKTKYKAFQNTCQLAYIGFNAFFSNQQIVSHRVDVKLSKPLFLHFKI